jgi:hypothetical protein
MKGRKHSWVRTFSVELCGAVAPVAQKAVELLQREIAERCPARRTDASRAASRIVLAIDQSLGQEGFRIAAVSAAEVRIWGECPRGLIYAVGKFLRGCHFGPAGFVPSAWRGISVPEKPVRGMYFATHFHNFYHEAPLPQVVRYVEELALWGCNALSVWFDMHHYTSMRDPAALAMVKRLRTILQAANRVGISAGFTTLANEAFATSPRHLRADWTSGHDGYFAEPGGHFHVELCPSKPGGLDAILKCRRQMLEAFRGIDVKYVWIWPYDQGGCTCSGCAPWGANGFVRTAKAEARLIREFFPKAKIVFSTWYFDHFVKNEWRQLDKAFRLHKPEWIDYVLADDGNAFPEYPLKHGVPGRFPLLTFPEISMFGMCPWGGFGANPLPAHFQRMWNSCRKMVSGGFPYSEGLFEDLNKAILLQFYWNSRRKALDTVSEYLAHECSPEAAATLVPAIQMMEADHNHGLIPEGRKEWGKAGVHSRRSPAVALYRSGKARQSGECLSLFKKAERQMPQRARKSWRWRILFLRAAVDAELKRSKGRATSLSERYFTELSRIYYAGAQSDFAVAPPSIQSLRRTRTVV